MCIVFNSLTNRSPYRIQCNSSSNRSPYRIQCNSSSNRSPYRIQCNSSSNRSPYRIQCNSSSNSLSIGYSVIVALTGLPIGYSVIVALTGLPIGYSVIVALPGLPIGYSVIVTIGGSIQCIIYRTHTKFRGLKFLLKISNYFCGCLFSWVLIFVVASHTLYSKMLSSTVHVKTNLSISIHATKEGRQHAKPLLAAWY